ncbi:EKC/KEOPS complex subunit LAGE3-like [Anneissia japonica]|uniref:EKC/KEOPS complex subunit LAGE3-like n=1 Tax=Anneissia japonica TaxID=1529436 RepID=UPI0014258D46|nr:EKC/KEOPS complex subunit LAGE3-like [Anneissia japonica]
METLKCNIRVPFGTNREAEIAYRTLRVDKEPRKGDVTKVLSFQDNVLTADITAVQARLLRVAVNSFMDHLNLVVQTIEQFGPPVDKT